MADTEGATFDPAVLARLRGLPRGQLVTLLRGLSEAELRTLHESWAIWALPGQREPAGDWQVWLIRAGRGFGKTRAGAEWVSALARAMPGARIAMVGGTMDDVRKVMVEGESGLIAVAQAGETYRWRRDAGEFVFDSGARAFVYSAEAPEKLRGPEHHAAWCDELAKWRYPVERQHYLSGFVTARERAGDWARIEAAAVAARGRGVGETFVWALPQVMRDGFVHFETEE